MTLVWDVSRRFPITRANIGLIIGLVIGIVSTVLLIWMGNVKEGYLNRELAQSRERTASLEKQSGESRVAIAKANLDAAQSLAAAKQSEANLAGANARAEEARADAAKAYARSDEAKGESAKSLERATDAQRHLAEANERAAHAEERAAEANLALERFKAPRSITKTQQDDLRDKLKSFSEITVDIFTFGETSEIVNLGNQMIPPLTSAGWSPRRWNITGAGAATGILVVTKNGSSSKVESAAISLVAALTEAGLAATKYPAPEAWGDWTNPIGMTMGPNWEKDKIAPIRMVIGSKP